MEKVAKRKRREREALQGLALVPCRVDPAAREVDGVTTVETAGAQTETAEDQIEEDPVHDHKGVDDLAAMEAARDHAPEAEEEGREVGTTHGIREEDESTEKKGNKDAAGLRIAAI